MLDLFISQLKITDNELIKELNKYAYTTTHKAGDLVIESQKYIKVLKIVLRGKVRVYQTFEDREILIYYLKSMETCTLSLCACFTSCKSHVNAVIENDSTLLNIPVRYARDWNYKYKSWNDYTTKTFINSYNDLMHQYTNMAFKPLKDRLIEYLISKAHSGVITKSHQELARELGSTREVISRLLKSLEGEHKIKLGQKMIVINKK